MKKYLNLAAFASFVMSLTFTACSSEDEQPNGTPFVPTPVELGVGLRTTAVTRADTWGASGTGTATWAASVNSIANFFAANDLVALISIDDTNVDLSATGDSARIKGLEYKASAASTAAQAKTGLTASSTKFYWTSSYETKRIIAWSVGRGSSYTAGTDGITVTPNMTTPGTVPERVEVVSDQSDDGTNVDFLWGFLSLSYDKKDAAAKKDIPMYHQLALLTVNITTTNAQAAPTACYFGKNLTSNDGGKLLMQGTFVPPIIVSSANDSILAAADTELGGTHAKTAQKSWSVAASPTYTDYTGSWIHQVKKGYIKPRRTAYDGTAKTASYSAVVMPYNYTSSSVTLFEITVDAVTYKYIPATADLQPGKHYTYTVNVGPSGLDVTASIQDWNAEVVAGTQAAVLDQSSVTCNLFPRWE